MQIKSIPGVSMIETTALYNFLNRVEISNLHTKKSFKLTAHKETECNYLLIQTEEKYSLQYIHMLYYIDI